MMPHGEKDYMGTRHPEFTTYKPKEADEKPTCPTCGARGFKKSIQGAHRCEFCDGTWGGNPPSPEDVDPA